MTITNARIVLEDKIIHGTIEFNNQKIMRIQANKKVKADYDAKGLYLLPAFVDSHTHGGYGFDFNMLVNDHHHDAMNTYLQRIHEEGVGSVLLTTVTCDDHDLNQIAQNYKVIKAHDHHNLIKG
jgi:N-acetylglucosamine-6-phosphate deacetylase